MSDALNQVKEDLATTQGQLLKLAETVSLLSGWMVAHGERLKTLEEKLNALNGTK